MKSDSFQLEEFKMTIYFIVYFLILYQYMDFKLRVYDFQITLKEHILTNQNQATCIQHDN